MLTVKNAELHFDLYLDDEISQLCLKKNMDIEQGLEELERYIF